MSSRRRRRPTPSTLEREALAVRVALLERLTRARVITNPERRELGKLRKAGISPPAWYEFDPSDLRAERSTGSARKAIRFAVVEKHRRYLKATGLERSTSMAMLTKSTATTSDLAGDELTTTHVTMRELTAAGNPLTLRNSVIDRLRAASLTLLSVVRDVRGLTRVESAVDELGRAGVELEVRSIATLIAEIGGLVVSAASKRVAGCPVCLSQLPITPTGHCARCGTLRIVG